MLEPRSSSQDHQAAIRAGDRFAFGDNWRRFLRMVNDDRIVAAMRSLETALGAGSLTGRTFLDIGCGSGLFSLAARRLGAKVWSFDFDPQSVGAAMELKRTYAPDDASWIIEEGSVLDERFLSALGQFDVVYSWGVLHHTGAMWTAIANAAARVKPAGRLFIAIYNDQGDPSRIWLGIKRTYNHSGPLARAALVGGVLFYFGVRGTARRVVRRATRSTSGSTEEARARSMSRWHDLVDWVGGYPFEVAKPEQVFEFLFQHGFDLRRLVTRGGNLGCNEYVFERRDAPRRNGS